jgi:hypothetical protein
LQPRDESGPPFSVTVAEIERRFSAGFELLQHWVPPSFPGREQRERMFLWRRRPGPFRKP